MKNYSRREASKLIALSSAGTLALPSLLSFQEKSMATRIIPSSGEPLPIVGLGTWQTFDVDNNQESRVQLSEVLSILKEKGGRVIDSSPMYGSSERVVGDLTTALGSADYFFYATKVWTNGKEAGIAQMRTSMQRMRRSTMDLIQIHNLIDWETHVKTLKNWKETEKIRYWGITHYVDSSHSMLEKIIEQEKPDFVQFNYSIRSRNAETSLFDTIQRNNTAVIINQPFESGSLFRHVKGKELPDWCKEYDINSWGQYFLKYILSNELVTCVIPGTSKPKHMVDNAMAGYGKLPDAKTRKKMVDHLLSI